MNRKYFIGMELDSNKYGKFKIIRIYSYKLYGIKFIRTGYEKDISYSCMVNGEIRDPYFPIYYDVACLGEVKTKNYYKELNVWRFMIARCYNKKHSSYKLYGEKGVTVCNEWLCFENFLKDIENIRGYDRQKFLNGEIELDKDISYIGENNKEYSIKTCIFLKSKINFDEKLARRKLETSSRYVGVTKLKDGKWQVTYVHKGKNIYGGRYDTEKDAHIAYERLKGKYLINGQIS